MVSVNWVTNGIQFNCFDFNDAEQIVYAIGGAIEVIYEIYGGNFLEYRFLNGEVFFISPPNYKLVEKDD